MTGGRALSFWSGCAAISAGILLHLPMLAMAHSMGNRLVGMPTDPSMIAGMGLIALGLLLACFGIIPKTRSRHGSPAQTTFEAPDDTPLNRWHGLALLTLTLALIIDTMKPATLGFVLPGLIREYGVSVPTAALLPLVALIGTTIGSFIWGWLADSYGRRVSILLSTILFVTTSICGGMPSVGLNLLMCFVMGLSAGGMLPVVYALLAEIMPPRHRSWVLVLIGGTGLVGGLLAASAAAWLFEPIYGWRVLWLQGFPTGLLLLALAPLIPESPRFLLEQGEHGKIERLSERFGIVAVERVAAPGPDPRRRTGLALALSLTALAWSLINFGVLLWLPNDLASRGFSPVLASGILTQSALLALPVVVVVSLLYSRWSAKWTLVGAMAVSLIGLIGALLPVSVIGAGPVLFATVAMLVAGTNGLIAVLLPYTAENYPLGTRGRATGLVAGSSKIGGVAVQVGALAGLIPTLAGLASLIIVPMTVAGVMVGWFGRETRGRSLRDLEH